MDLDPRFIVAPALQQLFRDKDTGLPLSGGKVFFYADAARTILKPVYELSSIPPNTAYQALPNPVILNSVGAFPEIIYYFPYNADGDLELYFIDVYSATDVFQFSVEAYPNVTAGTTGDIVDENFVSNGQFLLHNNIVAKNNNEAGEITEDVTDVAYGGWTFNTTVASGASDFVTFDRFDSYSTNPEGNPRYAIRVATTSPMTVLIKDLRLRFDNVNRFSSASQQFTFGFSGRDNNASTVPVNIRLIKNFGTGGSPSPQEDIDLGTINVGATYSNQNIVFIFGENTGKIIGTNDDDYIQLALRFPLDSSYSVSLTDFYLLVGDKSADTYPVTTDRQDKYEAIAGGITVPNYDGASIGLPVILTKSGLTYDTSVIGSLMWSFQTTRPFGFLPLDGAMYETSECNMQDGIPYSRIHSYLFDDTRGFPLFGTGLTYVTLIYPNSGDEAFLTTNQIGATGAVADGGTSTTFMFKRIHIGLASPGYSVSARMISSNGLAITYSEFGNVSNVTEVGFGRVVEPGTSGFTAERSQPGEEALASTTGVEGYAGTREIDNLFTIAATGLAGLYFTFRPFVSGTPTEFYVWFTVGGAGVDPSLGGTGIQVNLETADTAAQVAQKIMVALNGEEASNIIFVDGSTVPQSSYFTFDGTNSNDFYVWYNVDGGGTDPAVANRTGIEVDILSTDTTPEVAKKTQIAINSKFFALVDARGLFVRAKDDGSGNDPLADMRTTNIPGFFGDEVGTYQRDQVLSHFHRARDPNNEFGTFNTGGTTFQGGASLGFFTFSTRPEGAPDNTPRNISAMIYIRY